MLAEYSLLALVMVASFMGGKFCARSVGTFLAADPFGEWILFSNFELVSNLLAFGDVGVRGTFFSLGAVNASN